MKALRALGVYALLTAALTWPLVGRMHVMDPGDSAFFAWQIGWQVHALKTDPARLPHANVFHPLRYTLGMDEPALGTTVLVLPFAPFTDDAVLLFNLARLLTFVGSALTAYLLARELGVGEWPALFAGAAFAFSPIRTDQIAHLSTLGTQWLPLVWLFAVRYFRHGRLRDALLGGAAFALTAYACGYHGVIGLAVLPPAFLALLWGRWPRLPGAVLGAAVAAASLMPLYLLHRAALAPLQYERGPEETALYSAALESFLATSAWNRLYGRVTAGFRTSLGNNLFPGLVLPALALAGAVRLWRRRAWPGREALALAISAAVAVLVALGPELRLQGSVIGPGPFALARELPLFRMIRVPSRAGALLALPLALLAAKALAAWRPRPALLAAVATMGLAETLIVPIPLPHWARVVDSRAPQPPVYAWLASQPGEPVVAELPMLDISGAFDRPAFHESIYMVHSTRHWKPLVNGYAGIEPVPYLALREAARAFPSRASLDALRARGVRYVILHRQGYGPNRAARIDRELPAFAAELAEVTRFGPDIVYELR